MSAPLFVNSYLDKGFRLINNNNFKRLPSGSEHIESLVQIKVKVSVEMPPNKLMYLVLALGVKVLKLV